MPPGYSRVRAVDRTRDDFGSNAASADRHGAASRPEKRDDGLEEVALEAVVLQPVEPQPRFLGLRRDLELVVDTFAGAKVLQDADLKKLHQRAHLAGLEPGTAARRTRRRP